MNEHDNIEDVSMEERTMRYIVRRSAELRGERPSGALDTRTKKYISRRLAELRGESCPEEGSEEHPYIARRIAELRENVK